MKIVFLDFDGVLNSEQQAIWQNRITHRNWYNRIPMRQIIKLLDNSFRKLYYMWDHGNAPKWLQRFWHWWTDVYLFYLTDHCVFDPIACSNVQYILDKVPEARIVISSAWRSWGTQWCAKILSKNGIDGSKVIGHTRHEDWVNRKDEQRGDQIKEWLDKQNSKLSCMNVTHFVVIDDDNDMDKVRANFIQTDSRIGLTVRNACHCIKILGGELSKEVYL